MSTALLTPGTVVTHPELGFGIVATLTDATGREATIVSYQGEGIGATDTYDLTGWTPAVVVNSKHAAYITAVLEALESDTSGLGANLSAVQLFHTAERLGHASLKGQNADALALAVSAGRLSARAHMLVSERD